MGLEVVTSRVIDARMALLSRLSARLLFEAAPLLLLSPPRRGLWRDWRSSEGILRRLLLLFCGLLSSSPSVISAKLVVFWS